MKFLKSIAAAVALMFMAVSPALAEPAKAGERFFIVGDSEQIVTMISSSVERNGTKVSNWLFQGIPIKGAIANILVTYDCVNNTASVSRSEFYDYNGNQTGVIYPNTTTAVTEGSRYGAILSVVCGRTAPSNWKMIEVAPDNFAAVLLLHHKYVLNKTS
jgi:hypothetical protein